MSLKLTPIFLLISVIIVINFSGVYAYTDEQLTNMYRGSDDNATMDNIDKALRSGTLKCSDLSANLNFSYCNSNPQPVSTNPQIASTNPQAAPNNSFLYLLIIPIALIILVIILRGIISIGSLKRDSNVREEYESSEYKANNSGTLPKGFTHPRRVKKLRIGLTHSILIHLGILKVKKI